MTFEDLIAETHKLLEEVETPESKAAVRRILNAQLAVMRRFLMHGGEIRLPKLGRLFAKRTTGRVFRSVYTENLEEVPPRNVVAWKMSPTFQKQMPEVPVEVRARQVLESKKRFLEKERSAK